MDLGAPPGAGRSGSSRPNPHSESGQSGRDSPTGVGVSRAGRLIADQTVLTNGVRLEASRVRLKRIRGLGPSMVPRARSGDPRVDDPPSARLLAPEWFSAGFFPRSWCRNRLAGVKIRS